jgi:predicted N-formylglutamate amidohydrolase
LTRRLLISCEHGGNRIPAAYRHLFAANTAVLDTHRGFDIGALEIARTISKLLKAPLHAAQTSRLLVDLNRSLHHRSLYSEFSRDCDKQTRAQILTKYYLPYRQALEQQVRTMIAACGSVIHISVHSFTPVLDGQVRKADIGLLYDPARKREKAFCARLKDGLDQTGIGVIRLNYPYRGNADGLTTSLRNSLPAGAYLGIEIEINQNRAVTDSSLLGRVLGYSLQQAIEQQA